MFPQYKVLRSFHHFFKSWRIICKNIIETNLRTPSRCVNNCTVLYFLIADKSQKESEYKKNKELHVYYIGKWELGNDDRRPFTPVHWKVGQKLRRQKAFHSCTFYIL